MERAKNRYYKTGTYAAAIRLRSGGTTREIRSARTEPPTFGAISSILFASTSPLPSINPENRPGNGKREKTKSTPNGADRARLPDIRVVNKTDGPRCVERKMLAVFGGDFSLILGESANPFSASRSRGRQKREKFFSPLPPSSPNVTAIKPPSPSRFGTFGRQQQGITIAAVGFRERLLVVFCIGWRSKILRPKKKNPVTDPERARRSNAYRIL